MAVAALRSLESELSHIDGKAEIIDGEIVLMPPTGVKPGRASGEIYISLRQHERTNGDGTAFPDNVGFIVNLPNRNSFSPDAAWVNRELDTMQFAPCAPDFAAEVRSEDNHGPAAERAMERKRADYFAAGTQVVWDVDLARQDVIHKYSSTNPNSPTAFSRGEIADAEPAVPGWKMPVDELFPAKR